MLTIKERRQLTDAILGILSASHYKRICECQYCRLWGTATQRQPANENMPDKHCRYWGKERHFDDYCSEAVQEAQHVND